MTTLSDFDGTLAVYTTIYPGVEPYLSDWYHSLCQQTDQQFQLWIGLDTLTSEFVNNLLGTDLNARWVIASSGATPAQIRQAALAEIVETCSGVVLVDSDDVLHPSRVAAAREALRSSDMTGCALRLVDQQGEDLGLKFDLPAQLRAEDIFPRNNVFGFSNSAFRSDLLKRCLPIPAEAKLVDWFLATRAWLLGARLCFDRTTRMDYRQHSANTARVRSPFGRNQIVSDTAMVRQHFQFLLAQPRPEFLSERYRTLQKVANEIEAFQQMVVADAKRLDRYVEALNTAQPPAIWWACVAYPALRHLWN